MRTLGSWPVAASPSSPPLSLAVVAAATPAPAQALQGVIVTQSTPTYIGAHDFVDANADVIEVVDGGAADLYPSTIEVGEHFGTVATPTCSSRASRPRNLESLHVLLVAPDGRRALLLGHAGGANAYNGDLSLDDEKRRRDPRRRRAGKQRGTSLRLRSPGAPPDPAGPSPATPPCRPSTARSRRATGRSTSTTTTATTSPSTAGPSTSRSSRPPTRPSWWSRTCPVWSSTSTSACT